MLVRSLNEGQPPVVDMERVDLSNRACAHEVASVTIEDVAEDQVEAADEPSERDGDSDADDQHQPVSQSEASHSMRYPTLWTVRISGGCSSFLSLRRNRAT